MRLPLSYLTEDNSFLSMQSINTLALLQEIQKCRDTNLLFRSLFRFFFSSFFILFSGENFFAGVAANIRLPNDLSLRCLLYGLLSLYDLLMFRD